MKTILGLAKDLSRQMVLLLLMTDFSMEML